MRNDAVAAFHEFVEPTVDEFLSGTPSVRRARLAAIVLTHMADHVWYAENAASSPRDDDKRVKEFTRTLRKDEPLFALISDVANATKHVKLLRNGPKVSASSTIVAAAPPWGALPWGEFRWDGGEQIIAYIDNGNIRGLEVPTHYVNAMWRRRLGLPDVGRPGFPDFDFLAKNIIARMEPFSRGQSGPEPQ